MPVLGIRLGMKQWAMFTAGDYFNYDVLPNKNKLETIRLNPKLPKKDIGPFAEFIKNKIISSFNSKIHINQ